MRYLVLLVLLAAHEANVVAQGVARHMSSQPYLGKTVESKPVIDTMAINHWSKLGYERALSNDGKYFMYTIDNQPVDNQTLIIRSTTGDWEKEFPGSSTGIFSGDSKKFVFLAHDTLYFLSLGKDSATKIANIRAYRKPQADRGKWLAYQLNNTRQELVLHNLLTGEEQHFDDITDYQFDEQGNTLLLKKATRQQEHVTTSLEWVNLVSGKTATIWSSGSDADPNAQVAGYRLGGNGTQVAFIVQAAGITPHSSSLENTLWYYQDGMNKAVEKVNNKTSGIAAGLYLSASGPEFSEDGRYIYFHLEKQEATNKLSPAAVSVDVWSYKDTLLQSTQLLHPNDQVTYHAVIGTESNGIIQLTGDYEIIAAKPVKGDFIVVSYNRMRWDGDMYWLPLQENYYLVSLKDGSRKRLNTKGISEFWFSPGGRYLLYYDSKTKQYYSYNLQTGKLAAVSTPIPAGWLAYGSKYYRGEPANIPRSHAYRGVTGCWLEDDRAVWVYDNNYDIWQLDLAGEKPPVNITYGYGRSHHIEFRLPEERKYDRYIIQAPKDSLLLVAFNTDNKYNGFYQLVTGREKALELLVMGPWTWYHVGINNELDRGSPPLKAGDANIWVVRRQSATEAPNYFLTPDFKTYQPLTDLHPEKGYNWLTGDLVSWKQLDGTISQGILYKPENFDPHRKYPVLIHYYEQMSHRLYEYPTPKFARAEPDIAWLVSHGYLVLTPDIYYTNNIIGKSAENTVVSAARYLGRLPYVDAKRMGIAGHSYGGHETYYLITHTNLFSAVLASAGCANAVSESLSLSRDNGDNSWMRGMESRMGGATLWQNRERYIDESAVFWADKVKAPLLILQNKMDDHLASGISFFSALRRLGKKVWMLQYDQEGHVLGAKKDQIDFTLRSTQFFDYFLKGYLPPIWMIRGVPARLKGIDTGLELDSTGRQP